MSQIAMLVCQKAMRLAIWFVALGVPTSAWACSGLACIDPWAAAVRDGSSIPANVPALALSTSFTPFSSIDPADAGLEVLRADGGALRIEVSRDQSSIVVVKLLDGLTEGEAYRLRYPLLCREMPVGMPLYEAQFVATAARPLPTTAGLLAVGTLGDGPVSVGGSTMCEDDIQAAYARLTFVPSEQLKPFLPVTSWRLMVDGALWVSEPPGGINDVGQLTRQPNWNFLSLRRVLQVHAACRRDSSSANDQGLAIGQHTAVLQAFVAGVPQPLSLPIEFALQCSMHSSPDGGQLSEPDSGTTSGREADAGVSPPRAPAGCTSASGGWSSVLLALALFRRRRGVPTGVAPRA